MAKIRVYTKQIISRNYDAGLANSVHFELITKEKSYELNHGYGILFPKGEIREDNTIDPRGCVNPRIMQRDGLFFIFGDYINEEGSFGDKEKHYAWETMDFVTFSELGPVDVQDVCAEDTIDIDDSLMPGILRKWVPPYGLTQNTQRHFKYPLVKGYADPVIFTWEGKWYFLATNDLNGNIGIFMREADSVDGLFTDVHRLSVILDYDEEKEFIQTFWAPEWHIIGGVPYILFAVGGREWAPQSHMMRYRGCGDIMNPNSWDEPVRVRKMDGSFLSEDGITLDMTYLPGNRADYVIWSERYHIGTPLDSGSMLYIATVNKKNPTELTSDKVLLSRPLYGWENVAGTINNEGPYCLIQNGRVVVSYSGGDACGHYYAVGALSADIDDDLLDTSNWSKSITPFFSAYTLTGVDGPGHSSFFKDENGDYMIAFHGWDNIRQSGIYPLCFDDEGMPILIE